MCYHLARTCVSPPVVGGRGLRVEGHSSVRVLIDYRPALHARTGVGEWIHRLVEALADESPGSTPLELTLFSSSWKDRLGETPDGAAVVDRRIPVSLLNYCWHRLEWPPVESVAGGSFDIVHSPHPLLIPSRAAAQVVTVHDLDFLDHPERTSAEVRRDYPALAGTHARRAAQVVVPSGYTGAEVERRLGVSAEAITLCPNGAPDWPPRAQWPRPGHILFVGALAPRKNVDVLLEAYAALLTRRPDLPPLVLAGPTSPDAAAILAVIDRPPLRGRVRTTGYVTEAELRGYYEQACVLVLPSLHEGFGLPALEAMTVGVPVVVAERGALPEIVKDAGLLIDPTRPVALADAIERMITDEALARRCVDRGFERAAAYSWRASAEQLRVAYAQAFDHANRDRRA